MTREHKKLSLKKKTTTKQIEQIESGSSNEDSQEISAVTSLKTPNLQRARSFYLSMVWINLMLLTLKVL